MQPNKIIVSDFGNKIKKLNLCYSNRKRIEINTLLMKKAIKKNDGPGLKLLKNYKNENSQYVELLEKCQ